MRVVEAVDQKTIEAVYVTNGVAAIWESHKKAMKEFLTSNENYAIILEDDFEIEDERAISVALSQFDLFDADFIQLGYLITGIDTRLDQLIKNYEYVFFRITARIIKACKKNSTFLDRMRLKETLKFPSNLVPYQVLPGAHAYVISRKFAEFVLSQVDTQIFATDNLFMALAPMRTFKMLRLRTSAVKQRQVPTTISERFKSS